MRGGLIITMGLVAGVLAGCAQEPQRRTSVISPQWIGPLSEAEFDVFATSAAERLLAALAAEGPDERWIAPPAIVGDGLDVEDAGPEVAQRVAHGINDRLGRAACFAPTMPWPVDLLSRLEFRRDAADGRLHVTLVVHRSAEQVELLRHSFAAQRAASTGETLAGAIPPREE